VAERKPVVALWQTKWEVNYTKKKFCEKGVAEHKSEVPGNTETRTDVKSEASLMVERREDKPAGL